MSRRAIFWIVVTLSAAIVVVVTGAIVYSFFSEDVVTSSEGSVAYLVVFALVFCDAIVPIFPGETTLNTASVLASQGTLELRLVIVAGALGQFAQSQHARAAGERAADHLRIHPVWAARFHIRFHIRNLSFCGCDLRVFGP